MNCLKKTSLFFILISVLSSCTGSDKRETIAKNRADWEASLPDSLDKFRSRSHEIADSIPKVSTQIAEAMSSFSSAGGYISLNDPSNKFPPQSPGLTARISTKKGALEIFAAADAPFSSVSVASDGKYFSTSDIESKSNFSIISGAPADSIAAIIYSADAPVKITLGNLSFSLAENQKAMIDKTYQLLQLNRTQTRLQKQLPAVARKIRATENMIERIEKRNK